jgi:hypothetical protein
MPIRRTAAVVAIVCALGSLATEASANPYANAYNGAARAAPHVQRWVQQPHMPYSMHRYGSALRENFSYRNRHYAPEQFRMRTTTPQYTTRRR